MKRILLSGVMVGVAGLFTGCGEESKTETKQTTQTPGGSETKTITEKDKKTGDMKDSAAPSTSTTTTTTKP